jgi:hypothetical protein
MRLEYHLSLAEQKWTLKEPDNSKKDGSNKGKQSLSHKGKRAMIVKKIQ